MQLMRTMLLTMHSTMSGFIALMEDATENSTAMGKAFDAAQSDDSFYLPPEVFENADFKRAMELFFSPDGKAVRFIISHRGDPGSPETIAQVDKIRTAAVEALKVSPLEDARISLAGTAPTYKDLSDGSYYDLLIAGVAALCLIFTIMLIITRSFIAALVIVGTVALSLGAAFGLSVLIWQHILGIELHWLVLAMSVIVLLAVGSDYNLLLVSRMKEEIRAGLNTGIIRAMGGSGKVVTAAGLVFAFTMMSMVVERPANPRAGGFHHWAGSLVRHAGGAFVHDSVDRRAAGTLVLVAAASASPPRKYHASVDGIPSSGAFASTQPRTVTSTR